MEITIMKMRTGYHVTRIFNRHTPQCAVQTYIAKDLDEVDAYVRLLAEMKEEPIVNCNTRTGVQV